MFHNCGVSTSKRKRVDNRKRKKERKRVGKKDYYIMKSKFSAIIYEDLNAKVS